jgi:hypothetical protein
VTPPVIYGLQPDLIGRPLDRVLAEFMSSANEPGRCLTVVYLKSGNLWTRVALDAGTIHWKAYETEPTSWASPDEGFSYDLEDVGMTHGLAGSTVDELKNIANGASARVEFRLSNKCSLVLVNEDDRTKIFVFAA